MDAIQRYAPTIGRILIALIFVIAGLNKIISFSGTVGYIASQGVLFPQIAAVAAIIIELIGGLVLIMGWNARIAATALLLFTALAALIFHAFWAVPADMAQNQMIHFMKNLSIMGGLLYVIAFNTGQAQITSTQAAR